MAKWDDPDPEWTYNNFLNTSAKSRLRSVLGSAGEPSVSRESIAIAVKKVALQKKVKTNGKQKGKRAERELVQLFCTWWEKSTGTPNAFARTPDSGAFATRRRKLGQEEEQFQGDVYGPPECTLHIEAKHREGWSFDSFVSSPKDLPKSFLSWWAQADRETPTNKTPILVFRKNHMPWMVARRGYLSMDVPGLVVHVNDMPLAIYPLSVWLEENNPHFYGAAGAQKQPE